MEAVRQYLLSVTAAALVCGIAQRLLGKKGTAAGVGKMLTGLFLAFTVISPFTELRLGDLTDFTAGFEAEAADAAAAGQSSTRKALAESIINRTQTYILEKAKGLNLELSVEVKVSEADIPLPVEVRLSGSAAPYAKQRLQTIIEDDLGIPKENQLWT